MKKIKNNKKYKSVKSMVNSISYKKFKNMYNRLKKEYCQYCYGTGNIGKDSLVFICPQCKGTGKSIKNIKRK
jgi:DnaJ-class molecular chaperone